MEDGRKKTTTPKPKRQGVMVYFTEEERRQIEAIAEEWGCGISPAIRRLIREASKKKRPRPKGLGSGITPLFA